MDARYELKLGSALAILVLSACRAGTSAARGAGQWEHLDSEHRGYMTADPRDTGQDRSSRVGLDADLPAMRHYTLQFINGVRAMNGRGPLFLNTELNAFAQQGSIELSINHIPHHHFEESAFGCGCHAEAENQGSPTGWAPGPVDTQISEMLSGMLAEGPGGGHHDAMLWPEAHKLGVGIVNPGWQMYFTNDFGR